jgi:integrase
MGHQFTTQQNTFLLWQLHTMVRPSEAAGTAWSEIDLEKRLWTIPASRMKKKREHTVPLTDQMIEILTAMEPISCRCDYVFPSDRKPLESTNAQTANMALKRMGYEGQLVSHGLRALASTCLNEKGFEPDIIETALAHVDSNSVRAAYNRADYIDRRRSMMDWWSKRISQSNLEMPTLQKHK